MTILDAPADQEATSPEPIPPKVDLRAWDQRDVVDGVGAALSSLALTWLVYEQLTPLSGGLGFFVSWFVVFLLIYSTLVRQRFGPLAARDRIVQAIINAIGGIILLALVLLIVYVVFRGAPFLRTTFFYKDQRFTGPLEPATAGGGLAAIVGTVEQVGIAMVISVPLGICTALFLSEVGGPMTRVVRLLTEAMTGIPSILAGLFVYAFLILSLHVPQCGFAVAIALSVSMLPTVSRSCEVVFRLVPGGLREASLALGGTEWRMARRVLLPTARAGLVTAIILGIARVAGETAPNILDSGYSNFVNYNPFHGQQDSLPYFIFRLIREPIASEHDRGFTGALVLSGLILVLFVVARVVGGRGVGRTSWLKRRFRKGVST
jgi:phosphate transport system permease protein